MLRTLNITDARNRLTEISQELTDDPTQTVQVTNRGTPTLAILPWDVYESVIETLDVMSDPDLMAQIRRSAADIAAERTRSLEEIAAELGVEL